jgi:hypothetical protein
MALTVTTNWDRYGAELLRIIHVDFDSSYPTGGESFTPADAGFPVIYALIAEPKSGYIFEYDYTNEKIKAYYCDYDSGSDDVLIEVANTTDLSAVTGVRLLVFGR